MLIVRHCFIVFSFSAAPEWTFMCNSPVYLKLKNRQNKQYIMQAIYWGDGIKGILDTKFTTVAPSCAEETGCD